MPASLVCLLSVHDAHVGDFNYPGDHALCGGSDENGLPCKSHSFKYWVTREWHSLKGLGMALGGSVLQTVGFNVSNAHFKPRFSLFLLPDHPDVEFSATFPIPCLPELHHTSHHDDN